MRNELLIILNEFIKAEIVLKDKNISYQKKQLIDPEKWRKKFKSLFEREKVLDFDATQGSQIFAKKGIITNLEPKAIKHLGYYILHESSSFWVLFCNYNKTKIDGDIDMKEKVRRQIVDNFFEVPAKFNQ